MTIMDELRRKRYYAAEQEVKFINLLGECLDCGYEEIAREYGAIKRTYNDVINMLQREFT
jgi:hypothetical protein